MEILFALFLVIFVFLGFRLVEAQRHIAAVETVIMETLREHASELTEVRQ